MTNPLDSILAWYTTAKDGMRVTRRVLENVVPKAITNKHVFYGKPQSDNLAALDRALEELNRLTVLAFTATFERALRDFLLALPIIVTAQGSIPLHDRVRGEIINDMEFWNISSRVVDLFTSVDPSVRGQVKQIIDYRNWVAHGKTQSQPPPIVILPTVAHQRLTAFLTQATVI